MAPVGQRSKKDINQDNRKILFPCDVGPNDTGGDDGAQNGRQEKKVLYEKTEILKPSTAMAVKHREPDTHGRCLSPGAYF